MTIFTNKPGPLLEHELLCSSNGPVTEFQRKVYRALLEIPRGRTRSYKWVAKRIGRPNAYRAVGNALNKNPYPGIIPCHRVIKADGGLGGFSKGLSAKKRLLSKEGVMV